MASQIVADLEEYVKEMNLEGKIRAMLEDVLMKRSKSVTDCMYVSAGLC